MEKLTKSNMAALKATGSLANNSLICRTVRDAIQVTKSLGIPYLWVDSLCIVQDDPHTLQTHLRAMGSIYESAYVTIVAAEGGDSSFGLRGMSVSERSPKLTNHELRLPCHTLLADPLEEQVPILHRSVWDSRGWTFQEYLFSRRLLIFNGRVHWSCATDRWVEGVEQRIQGPRALSRPRILSAAQRAFRTCNFGA